MKIIIDAMGGDHAPSEPVLGGLQAVKEFGVSVLFTGNEEAIRDVLQANGYTDIPDRVEIRNCTETIDICDDPALVWRRKKDSSMVVGLNLLKSGEGDAFISAGSTGALLSGATMIVKRIPGVKRAAVAPVLPNRTGHAVLIDAGANSECTPEQLVQFAVMGSIYAGTVLKAEQPRIGLLNIGQEPSKGTELYRTTYQLLSEKNAAGELNFIGNIEGSTAMDGVADVIVADGFTGNIFLKTVEGTASVFSSQLKDMLLNSTKTKIAALMIRNEFMAFRARWDYKEIGGTALLGIARPVIKAHGSSNAYAFRSAVRQAVTYIENETDKKIMQQLNSDSAAAAQ